MNELTHASFFSGVGGLDLGLERAGWRTVSFSEIDPYASAVLAERWPGVPNLGDIVRLAASNDDRAPERDPGRWLERLDRRRDPDGSRRPDDRDERRDSRTDWARATLWSGGFPCQDLSVAGKRAGFAGARSGLAFAFLDLVERYRPPAILLENVPGLLSSHAGRDMGALLGRLVELGYGVGYRILDARHFGVPQRRRRVFVVGVAPGGRAGALRAAEVLSVGSRCGRHPATGVEAGPDVAVGAGDSPGFALNSSGRRLDGTVETFVNSLTHDPTAGRNAPEGHVFVSAAPDADRVRAADGLAGRLDDLAGPLLTNAKGGQRTTDLNVPLTFAKVHRAADVDDAESWGEADVAPTLNDFDSGDARAVTLVASGLRASDGHHGHSSPRGDGGDNLVASGQPAPGDGLPLGLDSHRYRCCGNGVVSDVAEWIGRRLAEALA